MKFTLPQKFTIPKMEGMNMPKMEGKIALPKSINLDVRFGEVSRYFSGNVFEKALVSLDKATLWIIAIVWLVGMIAMGGAFFAVKSASAIKLQAETAQAMLPPVPQITRSPLSKDQYQPLVARVQKQFPGLTYELTNKPSLRVFSNNGELFNTWLNAIGYTDSLVPTVRWNLTSFCAGSECPGTGLMQAELIAETITISQAEGGGKPPAPPKTETKPATPAH